jgi:hypothetical protein
MDPALKARWIAALRSGKYKQGIGYLEYSNKFCCLGVLCLVQDRQPAKMYPRLEMRGTSELPVELSGGLDSMTCENLANMNDSGVSFSEIAQYIEREL